MPAEGLPPDVHRGDSQGAGQGCDDDGVRRIELDVVGGKNLNRTPVRSSVRGHYFAVPICGAWLSTNLYSVATYMADARAQQLPLLTVGDPEFVEHDWFVMFSGIHVLGQHLAAGRVHLERRRSHFGSHADTVTQRQLQVIGKDADLQGSSDS